MSLSVAALRAALAQDSEMDGTNLERDPLAPLRALPKDADLETIEQELRALAFRATGRDRLGLTLLWEGAIRELERIGVSSPARLVDAALGTVSESPASTKRTVE